MGTNLLRFELVAIKNLRILLWLLLCLEVVAVALVQRPWLAPDSRHYLALAYNLSLSGFASEEPGGSLVPEALRVPGYPLFLNLLLQVAEFPLWSVIVTQGVLFFVSSLLIARFVIRDQKIELVFIFLLCTYVFPLAYSLMILGESIVIFIFAVIVSIISRLNLKWPTSLLVGILTGLGSMVRTDFAPIAVGVIIITLWKTRGNVVDMVAAVVAFTISFAIVLFPYSYWNLRNFDKFTPMPVASTVGQSLYLATWEDKVPFAEASVIVTGHLTRYQERSELAADVRRIRQNAKQLEPKIQIATNFPSVQREIALSHAHRDAAWQRIQADPISTIVHAIKANWRLFNTAEYGSLPVLIQMLLHLISNTVWFAAFCGLFLTLKGKVSAMQLEPGILALAFLLPHLPFHTEARYTAPLRMVLVAYAAIAVSFAWRRLQDKRKK